MDRRTVYIAEMISKTRSTHSALDLNFAEIHIDRSDCSFKMIIHLPIFMFKAKTTKDGEKL